MACSRDTRVGCVRAQLASSLGCPFWVPSSLSVPHSHPQGPWSGQALPIHSSATPARPAMRRHGPKQVVLTVQGKASPGQTAAALEAGVGGGPGDSLGEKTQPAYVLHSEVSRTPCSL